MCGGLVTKSRKWLLPKSNIVALSVKKEVTIATNIQVKSCQIQFNISQQILSP